MVYSSKGTDGLQSYGPITVGSDGALYWIGWTFDGMPAASISRCTPDGQYSIISHLTDGAFPGTDDELIASSDKHLYRVSNTGGAGSYGSIYKISLNGDSKVIHMFDPITGFIASRVTIGEDGSLWGTVNYGGPNQNGGVFRIGASGQGFQLVHSFTNDESYFSINVAGLTLGPDHRFYGILPPNFTTSLGRMYAVSSTGAFSIIPLTGLAQDSVPYVGLTLGPDNDLYGVTSGGSRQAGVIVKTDTSGQYKIVDNFAVYDGSFPETAPILAADGNYYGTTGQGGHNNAGTIFRITPAGKEQIIHSFTRSEGGSATLTLGSDGLVYGNNSNYAFRVNSDGSLTTLKTFQFAWPMTAAQNGTFFLADFSKAYVMDVAGTTFPIATIPAALNSLPGPIRQGSDGYLYSVAPYAGKDSKGAIVKAAYGGKFAPVFSFQGGQEGQSPDSKLVTGPDGNLYGVSAAGSLNNGVVFRFNIGSRRLEIIHAFPFGGPAPAGSITMKADGTIVGTAGTDHPYIYTIDAAGVYSERVAIPNVNDTKVTKSFDLALQTNGAISGSWSIGGLYGGGSVFTLPGL